MARQTDIEITQVRSLIGAPPDQRRTVRSLGLRRIRHTVSQPDRPEIRGMIAKVAHLVQVRYPGQEEPVEVEPGQEPKGAGQPAAGPSIADEEAAELRAAEEEALSQPGTATPAGVEQLDPRTKPPAQHERPKRPSGPPPSELDEEHGGTAEPAEDETRGRETGGGEAAGGGREQE
jgi:large subunit ribosomal protein L30